MLIKLGRHVHRVSLPACVGAPTVELDPRLYIAPPLRKQCVGWNPEWGKVRVQRVSAVVLAVPSWNCMCVFARHTPDPPPTATAASSVPPCPLPPLPPFLRAGVGQVRNSALFFVI